MPQQTRRNWQRRGKKTTTKKLTPLSSSERKSGPSSSPSCCQKESTESTKCVAYTFSRQFTSEETYSKDMQAKNTGQVRRIVKKNLPSWLLLRVEYGSGDGVWRHVRPRTQWAEPRRSVTLLLQHEPAHRVNSALNRQFVKKLLQKKIKNKHTCA